MSITAAQPATTPISVQLSELEFEAFILPHLSTALVTTVEPFVIWRRLSHRTPMSSPRCACGETGPPARRLLGHSGLLYVPGSDAGPAPPGL